MKKFFKIVIILVAVWIGYQIISLSFVFLPEVAYQLRHLKKKDAPSIVVPEESTLTYDLTLSFPDVSAELKNLVLDCKKTDQIPAEFRKSNILCRNVYETDEQKLKADLQSGNQTRVVLFGKHIIFDFPSQSGAAIKDPIGDGYKIARFMDSIAYPKAAESFQSPIDPKRLYVNISKKEEFVKQCGEGAEACFFSGKGIFLKLPVENEAMYSVSGIDRDYKYGHKAGKNKEVTYWYNYVYPSNCVVPPTFIHEFAHYFNFLGYGSITGKEMWLEEGVGRLFEDNLFATVCPPGISITNAQREENGKKVDLEKLDLTAPESIASFLESYWSGDRCKLAYFLVINEGIRTQGSNFHEKMSQAIKNKTGRNRINSLIEASTDQNSSREIFEKAGCFSRGV